MHEGVIRDLEHQRLKRERQQDFELQQALEAQYRREGQNVVPSPLDDPPPISRTGLADKEKSKG